jgi:CheY-like chemotaxis protein
MDGLEALNLLPSFHDLDLIITDVSMPKLDGITEFKDVGRQGRRANIIV